MEMPFVYSQGLAVLRPASAPICIDTGKRLKPGCETKNSARNARPAQVARDGKPALHTELPRRLHGRAAR